MRSFKSRVRPRQLAPLLMSATVFLAGSVAAITAPLPGASSIAVAADHRSSDARKGTDHNGGDNSRRPGKPAAVAPPTAAAAKPAPPPADATPAPVIRGTATHSAVSTATRGVVSAATDTGAAAPAAPTDAAVSSSEASASQPADQPASSLPGQLISSSPSPAAAGASPIRIAVLASWAVLSVLALVLVRRRLRQTGRVAKFIPMTLGTYAFRK